MRAVRLVLWLTGAAYCGTMTVGAIRGDVLSPDKALAHWGTGLILITAGLVLWERRPETRTGMFIAWASFAFAVNELPEVFPGSTVAMTAGLATTHLDVPIIAQMVLSYPTGLLGSRRARAFVAACYAFWFAYAGMLLLFYDPRAPHDPDVWEWPRRALPLTHVQWHDMTGARRVLDGVLLVLIVGFVALLVERLVRATPGGRRVVLPLAVAALFVAAQFAVQVGLWARGSSTNFWTSSAMFWSETIATLGVIAALAAGVLLTRGPPALRSRPAAPPGHRARAPTRTRGARPERERHRRAPRGGRRGAARGPRGAPGARARHPSGRPDRARPRGGLEDAGCTFPPFPSNYFGFRPDGWPGWSRRRPTSSSQRRSRTSRSTLTHLRQQCPSTSMRARSW